MRHEPTILRCDARVGCDSRALHDYGDYNLSTYSHGIHEYEYIGLKGTHTHEYHIAKVFMSMSTG